MAKGALTQNRRRELIPSFKEDVAENPSETKPNNDGKRSALTKHAGPPHVCACVCLSEFKCQHILETVGKVKR